MKVTKVREEKTKSVTQPSIPLTFRMPVKSNSVPGT